MSTRFLLKVLVALGVLVLVMLAAQTSTRTTALSPAKGVAMSLRSAVGSDWIERHPSVTREDIYIGSDWIERHPSVVTSADIYVGSDWIERHPSAARADIFVGSDYYERHPVVFLTTARYTGSDYGERHPSSRYDGSDFGERHPDLVNP